MSKSTPPNGAKAEPWLSSRDTLLPVAALPDYLVFDRFSRTSDQVFVDVPDEAPDISPNEAKVRLQIWKDDPRFPGMCRVVIMANGRFTESHTMGGVPTKSLLTGPQYYLTEAGVRGLCCNLEHREYADWRLCRAA